MSSFNPLEEIPVTRAHLERVRETLNAARGYHTSLDIGDGFRSMKPEPRPSRLTVALTRAIEQMDDYLLYDDSDEEE